MTYLLTRARHLGWTLLGAALVLSSCAGSDVEYNYPRTEQDKINPNPQGEPESVLSPGGLILFGGGNKKGAGEAMGIPVNSLLWRASLDTLSFMPLASADPFGGVIITDWYAPAEASRERFKTTVYILSRELRSDGLRVAVFRQRLNGDGTWSDAEVNPTTRVEIEDAILTRARQLRVAAVAE